MPDREMTANEMRAEIMTRGNEIRSLRTALSAENAKREAAEAKVEAERGYTREVADLVLRKIEEIEFKTGRNLHDPFKDNNLPPTHVHSDTITLRIAEFKKFRDDFSMMTAFLAHMFKDDKVSPMHLIPYLRAALSPAPATEKKCGHGPEMLKVFDLYCAQCVEEAK